MKPLNSGIGWVVDNESKIVHLWEHKKIQGHPKTGRRFSETHDLSGSAYCQYCLRHEFPHTPIQLGLFNLSTVATDKNAR